MSSYVYNSGSIELDKELNADALTAVLMALKEKGEECKKLSSILCLSYREKEICFKEYCDDHITQVVQIIVDTLRDNGYVVNGDITYYGDYDGTIFIRDNVVTEYDKENLWKMTAPLEEILEVLRVRLNEAKEG